MKTALITGVSGQDGIYLSDLLLAKSYRVIGTSRDPESAAARFAATGATAPEIVELDLQEDAAIATLIERAAPDEIYNLAAYAVGSTMWDEPTKIAEVNGITVARILEAIRRGDQSIRLCQASSSEMFGHATVSPQSENVSFVPRSPYGAAKLYAHNMIRIYREHYGLFACSAILFNHESPARSLDFVTRKVTHYAAKIGLGLANELPMGNLDARRDWGYAADYMNAAWMMLQHDEPLDYVVSTGESHSVRELCEIAFSHLGLDYRKYVVHNADAWRGVEPVQLVGDSSRLRKILGWRPQRRFEEMIRQMVDNDLHLLRTQTELENKNAPSN